MKSLEAIIGGGLFYSLLGCINPYPDIERKIGVAYVEYTPYCWSLNWVEEHSSNDLCTVGDSVQFTVYIKYASEWSTHNSDWYTDTPAPAEEIDSVILNEYHIYGNSPDSSLVAFFPLSYIGTQDPEEALFPVDYGFQGVWKPEEYNVSCPTGDEEEQREFEFYLTTTVDYSIPVNANYTILATQELETAYPLYVYDQECTR